MKKPVLTALAVFIGIAAITYGGFAFSLWELSPARWSGVTRTLFVFVILFSAWFAGVMVIDESKSTPATVTE